MRDFDHNEHVNDRLRYLHDGYERDGLPTYPNLGAGVAKLRKRAADICIVHRAVARREHGLAVLEAVRKLNYRSLQRELPTHNVNCASGTNHNDGAEILKALRLKAWQTCNPDTIRAARPIESLQHAYDVTMVEKRYGTNLNAEGRKKALLAIKRMREVTTQSEH
jgi:hypothetical protein